MQNLLECAISVCAWVCVCHKKDLYVCSALFVSLKSQRTCAAERTHSVGPYLCFALHASS